MVFNINSDVVSVRQSVGNNALFDFSAIEIDVCRLDLDVRFRTVVDVRNFLFGNGHFYLHRIDVEDSNNGLCGECGFACADKFFADDSAFGSGETAVGKVFLSGFELRLCLRVFALNFNPLHLRQRAVVVKHFVTFDGVVSLRQSGFCNIKHIARLSVVHFGNQLTLSDFLTFRNQNFFHHAHTRKTYRNGFVFFHNTAVSALQGGICAACCLGNNPDWRLLFLYLLTLAASDNQQC